MPPSPRWDLPLPAAGFPRRAQRVADLTHRLVTNFPSFFGPQVVFGQILTDYSDGFFSKEWTPAEHGGTHMDSPAHLDEGNTPVDAIARTTRWRSWRSRRRP